jgi:hypothetical protein
MPLGHENSELKTISEWEEFLTSVILEMAGEKGKDKKLELGYKILDPIGFLNNEPYEYNGNNKLKDRKFTLLHFLSCADYSLVYCKVINAKNGIHDVIEKAIKKINEEMGYGNNKS